MAQVLDYSSGQPGALAIARAGYIGAVRYIGFPDRRKCTTRAEFEDFSRNGIGMALVYEDTAGDWRGGFGRGREAGARARWHANEVGFPAGRPIYMAIDQDVATAVEFSVMSEYLRGAAETLGGVAVTGVYGEHDVCARAANDGVASWFWQCRAWSGTPIRYFADRHLFQRVGAVQVGGIDCDINDVMRPDWGQHNAQEDDMFTDADHGYLKGLDSAVGYTFAAAGRLAGEVMLNTERLVIETLAAVREDLDAETVLSRLEAVTRQAVGETVLPAIQQIKDALAADDTDQAHAIVTELLTALAERLGRPAA